jgi:hypothetical protein
MVGTRFGAELAVATMTSSGWTSQLSKGLGVGGWGLGLRIQGLEFGGWGWGLGVGGWRLGVGDSGLGLVSEKKPNPES